MLELAAGAASKATKARLRERIVNNETGRLSGGTEGETQQTGIWKLLRLLRVFFQPSYIVEKVAAELVRTRSGMPDVVVRYHRKLLVSR